MLRKKTLLLLSALTLIPMCALAQTKSGVVTQITTQLQFGDQSDQVKVVQALLASDPTIFPEANVTGFFGTQTRRAVTRFQKAQGLEQVGRVGPKTLGRLNLLLQQFPLVFESTSTASASQSSASIASNAPHLCLPSAMGDEMQKFVKSDGTTVLPPCMTTNWGQFGTTTGSNGVPLSGSTSGVPDTSGQNSDPSGVGDLLTICTNPWAATPSTIKWPKGLPCPKPVAATNVAAPTPTPTTPSNQDNTSAGSSSGTKQCPVPWGDDPTITMNWSADAPCPARTQSATPAPTPAPSSPSTGTTPTPPPACLSTLSSKSTSSDFTAALSQCGGATLQPTPSNMQDKKMCTLTINGTDWKFPFPSNRDCPTASVGTPVSPNSSSSNGTCILTLNGSTVSVPWPSNTQCTGHL